MTVPTLDELTRKIEDWQAAELPDQVSMDKLTLHYLTNRTWAKLVQECYAELERGLKDLDPLRAEGKKLEDLVSPVLPEGRLPGDYASGYITFIADHPANQEITIPIGTRCYAVLEGSKDKIYFVTTEVGIIEEGQTEVTVGCRAEQRGTGGNVANYAIIQIADYIVGLDSCENRLAITGGTPDETDEELLQRYYDTIAAPGKATAFMLTRALENLDDVKEVKILNYGQGDIGVVVDCSGGISSVSPGIIDCLKTYIGGGIQARGILGATIDGSDVRVFPDDAYGGYIFVRPRNHTAQQESLEIAYYDMGLVEKVATVDIPAGTHRGAMIRATLESPESRAKRIASVTSSSYGNSYDILLGMGEAGILYNLPELTPVNIAAHIRLTDTPEVGLLTNMEASVSEFIDSLKIGERLEFSDVQRFMFNQFDPKEDDNIGRPFIGIDEIQDLAIEASGMTITKVGGRLDIEEDGRFEPGSIRMNLGD